MKVHLIKRQGKRDGDQSDQLVAHPELLACRGLFPFLLEAGVGFSFRTLSPCLCLCVCILLLSSPEGQGT